MKIVTVNIPEIFITAMDKLVGNDGIYPSRSELIRVAVRNFLIKELKFAEKVSLSHSEKKKEQISSIDENIVRVPLEDDKDFLVNGKEFKTFRLVRK